MILSAVIGISLVSYLSLARTAMTISNRAFYNNGSMNLAENGLERAVFAINKQVADPSYNWATAGWTISGADARQKWAGTPFDQGAVGSVRAYIYNYSGSSAPIIVARSSVQLSGSSTPPIEKWIEVQLHKTSKFAGGLVARNSISFSGNNASVDSWNSDPDNDSSTAAIPYSTGVRNDNGSVGSISVGVSAVLVQNADIWGYAATGGSLPQIGPNGVIGPFGTASGTMDMTRVSTDFTANFDPVANPAGGTVIAAIGNSELPVTLGTAGTTTQFRVASISASGNSSKKLTIQGDVTLVITASAGSNAISLTGQSNIAIAPGASLKIYTEGNLAIGGNGVANGGTTAAAANQPINFQVWGTRSNPTQTISIAGNGVLSGVIYAPNANVSIVGNGDVMGSVVANNISLTGNAAFHYDESLANMGTGNPYRVSRWKELTSAADRAAYDAVLSW
jgi:hypothetical protein